MKFHEYLDTLYINNTLEVREQFCIKKQAVTRAVPELLDLQRGFYKKLAYITVLFGFFKAKFTGKFPVRKELPKKAEPEKPKLEVVPPEPPVTA